MKWLPQYRLKVSSGTTKKTDKEKFDELLNIPETGNISNRGIISNSSNSLLWRVYNYSVTIKNKLSYQNCIHF